MGRQTSPLVRATQEEYNIESNNTTNQIQTTHQTRNTTNKQRTKIAGRRTCPLVRATWEEYKIKSNKTTNQIKQLQPNQTKHKRANKNNASAEISTRMSYLDIV